MIKTTACLNLLLTTHLHAVPAGGHGAGEGVITFDTHYWDLILGGASSVLIYLGLMILLIYFFYKKEKALTLCSRYLTHAFIVVWIAGFIIYDIGMYTDNSKGLVNAFLSMLGVAPMGVIHAFEMFALQSDACAIHESCHSNSWFMFFFSITHFMAAIISMVFVIKHFGFNIISSIIRFWKTRVWVSNKQDLYVFWGINEATYHLAKDIIKTGHNEDARMVIIRVNSKENNNKRIGMDRLFSFLSLSSAELEKLQELQKLGCMTNSTFGSMTHIKYTTGEANDIMGDELRLNSLITLIKHTRHTVHMLFLGGDETFNIEAIANLKKDKHLNRFADRGKLKFYCHARYNSIHRVIEDEPSHKNIEVKVVDSSHISVEMMKQDVRLQPVSYVDIQDDATVNSPFNALIVGFSEVGLDTMRFLYEFSAFVKTGSTRDNVMRNPFHCDVVDKQMAPFAGLFVANTPAITPTMNPTDADEASKSMICFHQMDCHSVKFYDKLVNDWLPKLNYVVLATGDDEMNISHAVRIFRLAIIHRGDLKRFRIMVRVQHDENGHLRKIAEHYNRLWAAENSSTAKEKSLNQHIIKTTDLFDGPITLFGSVEDIYTYNYIINEALKEKAKTFKSKYDLSVNNIREASNKEPYQIESWDELQNKRMQLTGDYAGYSPTFSGMMSLRRIQSQNIANSLHASTKYMLAMTALGGKDIDNVREHGIIRKDGKTQYTWSDGARLPIDHVQRVMDVLAQTEHLRWNASHEILGYRDHGDTSFKDEARMQHGCLKEWEELSEDIKSYDYNIVDVSLGVNTVKKDENDATANNANP